MENKKAVQEYIDKESKNKLDFHELSILKAALFDDYINACPEGHKLGCKLKATIIYNKIIDLNEKE